MPAFAQTILQGVLVFAVVAPVMGWDVPNGEATDATFMKAWDEPLAARRLTSSCDLLDAATVLARLDDKCDSECSSRWYSTSNSVCSQSGDTCSCSVDCKCGANYVVIISVAFTNVAWVILQLIVGCCLWGAVREAGQPNPLPKITQDDDFSSGVFDCCADTNTCCFGLCCPVVMASKIAHGASIMNYCCALTAYGILFLFPGWSILFWLVRFFFRMSFRQRAGLKQDCLNDFCCTLCCGPCSNCQEARHLNRAIEVFKSGGVGQARDIVVGTPVVVVQEELARSPLAENVAQVNQTNVPEQEEVQQSI